MRITPRFPGPATRWWAVALSIVVVGLPGRGEERDREWAETMVALRDRHRESSPSGARAFAEKMQVDFPYRTDWMLQDNGNDLAPWLAQRGDAVIERSLLRILGEAEFAWGGTDDPRWLERYAVAAGRRREQRLASLQREAPRIAFTKNHTIEPSFFAYTEGQSDAQAERHFTPGTALCVMTWDGAYARVTDLIDDPYGRIRDPEVDFEGRTILFAWKKSDRLDDYHLYEIVPDSGEIRQLTFGLGVADFEPCYLPAGDIVFSSSRCVQTVDCWWTEVSNLYSCGPNGEHLRRLGFDQVHTTTPSLLEDGRVIYTRWDYNDRGQVFPQGLFQMNPDGTGQTEFYGNNSWFPTTLSHARGIPGSSRVVAVAHGHHTWQAGELVWIDVSRGRQEAQGVQLIAPIRDTRAVREDRYGQEGDLFQYPFPINEREYLVAYSPLGGRPTRFSIYYMDMDGSRELLVSDPDISCQHPVPLTPRPRPSPRASMVDYTRNTGVYYLQDVYVGPGLAGVDRGTIQKLRVVELAFRAAGVGQNGSRGPAGGAMASTPISVGNGAWDVKRVIGDATVYSDGSAYFEAPARTPLYFQALDRNGSAVQTMRSWSTLMPGERVSCVGCHEDKNSAPPSQPARMAMQAGLQKLAPFYGPPRGFSFAREVQPILDAKCVSCHDGGDAFGLRGTGVHDPAAKRVWSESYLALTQAVPEQGRQRMHGDANGPYCSWTSAQSVPEMVPPYQVGSAVSPMMTLLRDGHEEVRLTREEMDKLACWIDLGVPFCGDYYEANAWTPDEKAFYDRYQAKREYFAALDRRNVADVQAGRPNGTAESRNPYRNIAPLATATACGECRNQAFFSALHVTDLRHVDPDPGTAKASPDPGKRDAHWLTLAWDEDVYVDRVQVTLRADSGSGPDPGHHDWWRRGSIELSTGRSVPLGLKKTADVQVITIPVTQWPPEPIRWLRFTDPDVAESTCRGLTDVDVMGRRARSDLLLRKDDDAM